MRNKLFTLIELLTVIGVIALLTSMLLPALRSARIKSQQSLCAGNQKQIGAALSMYCGDYNDWCPGDYTDSNSNPVCPQSLLNEIAESSLIWRCPGDEGLDNIRFVRACAGAPKLYVSQTYNSLSMNGTPGSSVYYTRHRLGSGHESKIIAFTDFQAMKISNSLKYPYTQDDLINPASDETYEQRWRHSRRPNVMFIDGHTENTSVPPGVCQWPDGWRWNKNHKGCPSSSFSN
jgi:prepilin-type processing-associated H-X9-DG protein